jgi:hypothetical protein
LRYAADRTYYYFGGLSRRVEGTTTTVAMVSLATMPMAGRRVEQNVGDGWVEIF